MKQTLSILLLLCLAMPLQAQSVLTGSVRSAESRQPVEFANVALFRSDSLLVGGAATDGRGRFRLAGIAAGRYALRVSCIGFQTAWLEFQCAAGTADLGEITLTPESQRLDEALVQAASLRKPTACWSIPQRSSSNSRQTVSTSSTTCSSTACGSTP